MLLYVLTSQQAELCVRQKLDGYQQTCFHLFKLFPHGASVLTADPPRAQVDTDALCADIGCSFPDGDNAHSL